MIYSAEEEAANFRCFVSMQLSNTNLQDYTAGHLFCQGNIYPLFYTAETPVRQIGMVGKEVVLRSAHEKDTSITQIQFSSSYLFIVYICYLIVSNYLIKCLSFPPPITYCRLCLPSPGRGERELSKEYK